MPYAAPKPCTYPGCSSLVTGGGSRCEAHPYEMRRSKSAASWIWLYKTSRWRKERAMFLQHNPLCVDCLAAQLKTAATVVDHDVAHKGNEVIFWDQRGWRARCKKHHDRKTASRDGGFGNKMKGSK